MKIIFAIGLITVCSVAALAGDTITGTVHNRTRRGLAIGDEVILLCLDQGMQQEARTKTDSQGRFALNVIYAGKPHLVRVTHQGVNYDQRVSPGEAVSMDVFDRSSKVAGISGNIEIIRVGSKGNLLHVSDMVEIKNDSRPPLTQAGERTFEVYLPAKAKIDSVLAAGAGKIGVMISAAPVPGDPGHYTVNFPLRPGATKFAFNYDVPYRGRTTFRTKSVYPLQQLAVMIPPTMNFVSRSSAFQALPTANNGYQVEAANLVKAGDGPGFEISGVGAIPELQAQAQSPRKATAAPGSSMTGSPQVKREDANASRTVAIPSPSLRWWIMGASAVFLFGTCGYLLWRRRMRGSGRAGREYEKTISRTDGLKDEMFQLELNRVRGTISMDEYASAKQALGGTVKRALARTSVGGEAA